MPRDSDDGRIGYARYLFNYVSKLPGVEGRAVVFDGLSQPGSMVSKNV